MTISGFTGSWDMATEHEDVALRRIAEALNHPEGGEPYQKAKAEFTYRQMKGQIEAFEQQQIAIEVQRENIAVQKAAIAVQKEALGVQKAAAEAEAKAADASIIGAKAAERNAKHMLASVIVAAVAAVFSAVSTGLSLWSVVHPR
jgi:hypothetical protein